MLVLAAVIEALVALAHGPNGGSTRLRWGPLVDTGGPLFHRRPVAVRRLPMDLDHLGAAIGPAPPPGCGPGLCPGAHWFSPLWALWWLTALPLGTLIAYWLGDRPDLWMITLWWFKPLFEALPLLWLGRALFGAPQALGRGPLAGRPGRSAPWWHRRSSRACCPTCVATPGPGPIVDLPVGLLEGTAREGPVGIAAGYCTAGTGPGWLTLTCVHLEMILALGAVLGLFFLVPEELLRLNLKAALFDAGSWASLDDLPGLAPGHVGNGPLLPGRWFALYLTSAPASRPGISSWSSAVPPKPRAVAPGERRRTPGPGPGGFRPGPDPVRWRPCSAPPARPRRRSPRTGPRPRL